MWLVLPKKQEVQQYKQKTQKMHSIKNLQPTTYTVIPVAMETLGSWGPQGLKFIKDIGSRIAEATGEKRSKYFIFQAISMAVQRGNVSSILGTIPDARKMEEVFYL